MRVLRREAHLDDPTLLLAAEGELSPRALRRAEEHVRACAECRGRQAALMAVEADVAMADPAVGNDAARERLVATMAAERRRERGAWLRPRFYLRMSALVVLLLVAFVWRQAYSPLQDRMAAYEETGPEPNHAITPGATRYAELTELCTLNDVDLDPQVSPEKQRAVFNAYGMDEREARAYQVDYLINPQLGGNDDTENLWPEPYHATVWNATAKDALEMRLHGMVCSGEIGLAEAQHDLATDWIGAYKKYFHTRRPVKTMAVLDAPTSLR